MIKTLLQVLLDDADFKSSDLHKESLLQTAHDISEKFGLDDIADFDSLEKAVKEVIEEQKNLGVDFDSLVDGKDIDVIMEDLPKEINFKLTLPEFKTLNSIINKVKPKKVCKWMVKDHTIKDLPFADLMTDMNIEILRDKFQEEDMKMTVSAIKKHIPKDAKVKFYAE